MICTECKATIADKAIVCYRCGAPTALPVSARPASANARPSSLRLVLVLELVAALFLVAFFLSEPGTTARTAFGVAAGGLFVASTGVIVRRALGQRGGPRT
jgi:hypothetical protein